jgi:MFS family permease
MSEETLTAGERLRDKLERSLMGPIRAMRLAYLPLLMVYFAYGALGLTAVAENFWIKKSLSLSPTDLASLGVWLTLPWTVKMVFGELVDSVTVLGSRRRAYVLIGGGMVAVGLLLLAGAAGGWLTIASPETLYIAASLLTVTGVVLQDVVADAMSTEVVPRIDESGAPRPEKDVERDLAMVQVLGRIALSLGIFAVAGVGGWLANIIPYEHVFLLALIVPIISVTGALTVKLESPEGRAIDWRILGGGLAFGAFVTALGIGQVPFGQEIVFVASMAVVIAMLRRVVGDVPVETQTRIAFAALIIFCFRATPGWGEGYRWFTIDVLGFNEAFQGTLNQIGALLALAGGWLLADFITRQKVTAVMLWLTLIGFVAALPNLLLVYGGYKWTERNMGIGAHEIALIDTAAQSPFLQLSLIPMLTLIAIYAPPKHRATWFALMASLMNLALVAGQLQTKYLTQIFVVGRGQYAQLPPLALTTIILGLVIPIAAILAFGKRVEHNGGEKKMAPPPYKTA